MVATFNAIHSWPAALVSTFIALPSVSLCVAPADARIERVLRRQAGTGGRQRAVVVQDSQGQVEEFDEVVFCCGAEEALRMLDKPSW